MYAQRRKRPDGCSPQGAHGKAGLFGHFNSPELTNELLEPDFYQVVNRDLKMWLNILITLNRLMFLGAAIALFYIHHPLAASFCIFGSLTIGASSTKTK